ncbi:rho family-interacting cell polarization regulator 1 [Hypanus sabinus]|uniref:rho family-interacting cell polarization regulator 1 n=1 Tax=Hypanus sabinus TaxID=79690 RepID=UPI0028C41200|nr:rho family-interacting cell polarization regulator 1 [Hypanus sabinus]XP_059848757.1 rho family-interacting cell polarization regulator 1 [Hypanus sabinus]XP_059848758.1 rho family-interacting cell polarization regulator 1 [Hypanus sabinus]XP_059848759.1 rho family-interacting cell polarization regulator 1 [Hypanus sabinus]
MSLSVRPARRIFCTGITRSHSFAGVNSPKDKTFRKLKVFSTPTTQRKTPSRASKMFNISHKSLPPKNPQPERLDEVYEALKKGLNAYLQVHQVELDNLTAQLKDMKRNSRLGFLYDLDKQIKSIERFIRRLEFHVSKIDELYESYCIQRRLRDGANNMVRAYSTSQTSREAKESLAEANKGYKEYTESMCTMESELENQLGEFHVKMKGLAGFARLCPGDQYEIFMKYGRQRWKLKGRIEANGKQVWDSEEMVFQPLVTEFLSIKVTELKSLANHVIVGNVSCETKDLFAALPQSVAVDINDLGTIKLSLEVIWNPFDKDDQASAASSVNKVATVNKRFSTYNQSPPDTPSLREQAFYNMLRRQEELENGAAWSISSDSSDGSSSPQLSMSVRHSPKTLVQPEIQGTVPRITITLAQTEEAQSNGAGGSSHSDGVKTAGEPEHTTWNGNVPISRTLSHISEASIDAVMDLKSPVNTVLEAQAVATTSLAASPPIPEAISAPALPEDSIDAAAQSDAPLVKSEIPQVLCSPQTEAAGAVRIVQCAAPVEEKVSNEKTRPAEPVKVKPIDPGIEEALMILNSTLDDYRGQFPELQKLETEVKHLEEVLLQKQGVNRSRASSFSLTVEHALESFDFLNTSDMEDSEFSEDETEKTARHCGSVRGLAAGPSEALTEDTGVGSGSEGSPVPMTTGNEYLDQVLTLHLNNCSRLLLHLGIYGPLRCREMYALDKLLREAQVLEVISRLSEDKSGYISTAEEVMPLMKDKTVFSFWTHCTESPNLYSATVERVLQKLNSSFGSRVNEQYSGPAETVFIKLVERILDRTLPKRARSGNVELLTIFQYFGHIEEQNLPSLPSYIMELAEEVFLVQNLQSSDKNVVLRSLKHLSGSQLQKDGLKAVGLLLLEDNTKIGNAAASLLRNLAEDPKFREKALVCYLELLEDEDGQLRKAGCTALAHLKAKESIDQLVYLCQTDKEVRDVAKQTLFSFGEEGKIAFRQMEESLDGMQRLLGSVSMASTAF